jgi:BirA family biotin operon repressor/biotin-[acetyl-CoA-carboxylase] ligase
VPPSRQRRFGEPRRSPHESRASGGGKASTSAKAPADKSAERSTDSGAAHGRGGAAIPPPHAGEARAEDRVGIPAEFNDALARVRLGRIGSTVFFYPTIGSTNDTAASLAASGAGEAGARQPEGLVVFADEQTAGRGRRGRSWFSPPGSGLYVSVVLAPGRARVDPDRATTLLTLAAGAALAEGIEVATGLRVDVKWPNDLLVGRRKLSGILAEGVTVGGPAGPPRVETVVLGYGINISPAAFPPALGDRATSIETELGRAVDRPLVLAETLAALSRRYDDLLEGRFDAILEAWRGRASSSRGARVTWQTAAGTQAGVTAGIDERGALFVRTAAGLERIVAGELMWM